MVRSAAVISFCLLAVGAATPTVQAYNLFGPYPWGSSGDTYYNKWGNIFSHGASGGTITWSIMPDGTTIDPSFKQFHDPLDRVHGTSSLVSIMNTLGYADALAAIQRSLDRWSAAANIYFEFVDETPGIPFNGTNAVAPGTGQIRFGAFDISTGDGAFGYAPPPNGGTLEGDVLLNANSVFHIAPVGEGELTQVNNVFVNDFESLIMHETGHAVGLDHSNTQSVTSLNFDIYKYVNRELDPDDVDGQDLATWASGLGTATGAERDDGDADQDGDVDGSDFLAWQREVGGSVPLPMRSVPEPGSMALAAFTCLAVRAYRRIRR